jgi:hypothetical protein
VEEKSHTLVVDKMKEKVRGIALAQMVRTWDGRAFFPSDPRFET